MVFQTVELPTLEKTINGNNYNHYENTTKENGFYTYKHICYSEIEREWNKRSHVLYSSIKNGSDFSAIIFRYLSSKGLKKDSIGLSQISDIEIVDQETQYNHMKPKTMILKLTRIVWCLLKNMFLIGL